jgi:hypothetical protein
MPISSDVISQLLAPTSLVWCHIGRAFSRSFADLRDFNPVASNYFSHFASASSSAECHSRERTTTSRITRQSNTNFASVKNVFAEIDESCGNFHPRVMQEWRV